MDGNYRIFGISEEFWNFQRRRPKIFKKWSKSMIFSAAGQIFSKNDQNQWFLYQNSILMGLFDIFLSNIFHYHEKIQKTMKSFEKFWKVLKICFFSKFIFFSGQEITLLNTILGILTEKFELRGSRWVQKWGHWLPLTCLKKVTKCTNAQDDSPCNRSVTHM